MIPSSLQLADEIELELEAWLTGNPGNTNAFIFEGDVPTVDAQTRLVLGEMDMSVLMGIPPGAIAQVPAADNLRKFTIFWDSPPANGFAVCVRLIEYSAE